jgi:hypothetical protein
MSRPQTETTRALGRGRRRDWPAQRAESWWSQHREAALNWLALGLLLAAWNGSNNEASTQAQRRPEALRGYASVSVRAAQRSSGVNL